MFSNSIFQNCEDRTSGFIRSCHNLKCKCKISLEVIFIVSYDTIPDHFLDSKW